MRMGRSEWRRRSSCSTCRDILTSGRERSKEEMVEVKVSWHRIDILCRECKCLLRDKIPEGVLRHEWSPEPGVVIIHRVPADSEGSGMAWHLVRHEVQVAPERQPRRVEVKLESPPEFPEGDETPPWVLKRGIREEGKMKKTVCPICGQMVSYKVG